MKKFYVILAAVAGITLTSCTSNEYLGDLDPTGGQVDDGSIKFGLSLPATTRADIYGSAAATLLGNNFYVTGTKGTEGTDNPTENLVFDNYLVHYEANTAGTREDNTANWEYVGITPGTGSYANWVKLSSLNNQTIKYWDYSTAQYDFFGFSTGTYKAVKDKYITDDGTDPNKLGDDEINVTPMTYGSSLTSGTTAYTITLPSVDALQNTYITDITEVEKANYGKEVKLKFKNLGSKVRIALYETVPGYSVRNVEFYTVDNDAVKSGQSGYVAPTTTATLISGHASGLPTNGIINVFFRHLGTGNATEEDYLIAAGDVSSPASGATHVSYKGFGTLDAQLTGKEVDEANVSKYIGRTLPTATFAGSAAADFYEIMFPVSSSDPLTLRVNYTLVSTDGSGETINVYGAKAVVPSTYTKWLPNYAYTYIFKISDNTNGWTDQDKTEPGLFPITFDAVVAEKTDATGEQTTITTVATPSITTYQQGHNAKTDGSFDVANEYDNDGEKLYVQVMDNNLSPAVLVGKAGSSTLPLLNAAKEDATPKYHASLLYKVSDANATEAMVMDALQKRTATVGNYNTDVKGRNGITLEYNSNINNAVTSIVNGVDDNAITVSAGQAAEINIASLTAGTYAYVYDYSWKATSPATWTSSTAYTDKSEVQVYQPITTSTTSPIGAKGKYYIAISSLTTWDAGTTTQPTHYTSSESAAAGFLYFSITTNGGATKTYSFVSVDGKIGTALPDGLLKVPATQLTAVVDNTANAAANTFYFDTYYSNNGEYAVKVIKIVD